MTSSKCLDVLHTTRHKDQGAPMKDKGIDWSKKGAPIY